MLIFPFGGHGIEAGGAPKEVMFATKPSGKKWPLFADSCHYRSY